MVAASSAAGDELERLRPRTRLVEKPCSLTWLLDSLEAHAQLESLSAPRAPRVSGHVAVDRERQLEAAGAEHSDPAERAGDARRPLERDAVLLALEQVASGDLLGNFREQRGQAAGD